MDSPPVCISIDVERDYRTKGPPTTRGIVEGLPVYLDILRSHKIPYDLMVSGEVVDFLPEDVGRKDARLAALGCHGLSHAPGYLNRMGRSAQERELTVATDSIRARFHRPPVHFRAPNFSANGATIRVLEGLGYRVDSSVLPGRFVQKWGIFTLVDHRRAPAEPYAPDPDKFPERGSSTILEVPVTPNPKSPGAPIGLGFLHSSGSRECCDAIASATGRYIVFLAHSWEMVSWSSSDSVAPWVRTASSSNPKGFEEFLSSLDGNGWTNMDGILATETQRAGR